MKLLDKKDKIILIGAVVIACICFGYVFIAGGIVNNIEIENNDVEYIERTIYDLMSGEEINNTPYYFILGQNGSRKVYGELPFNKYSGLELEEYSYLTISFNDNLNLQKRSDYNYWELKHYS